MSDPLSLKSKVPPDLHQLAHWQWNIEHANRHNIWCHCRHCDHEWVASTQEICPTCKQTDIEYISCWQFPDD